MKRTEHTAPRHSGAPKRKAIARFRSLVVVTGLDILMGGDGKDFMNGGVNTNKTFGGEGDDFVIAGEGMDAVFGDSGDDWVEGGDQPYLLIGDSSSFSDPASPGTEIGTTDLMGRKAAAGGTFGDGTAGMTLQQAVFAGLVDPGNIVAVREILPAPPATGPTPALPGTDVALFSGPRTDYEITLGTATFAADTPVSTTGPFAATLGTCPVSPATLAVGRSCNLSVRFTPTPVGPITGTLTVRSNAVGSPQTVNLTGTGRRESLGGRGSLVRAAAAVGYVRTTTTAPPY